MYLPPQFSAKEQSQAIQLMREHPFASLISSDNDGAPFVSHLPLHLEQRGEDIVLLGHCARSNPHWRYLEARPDALVTFLGPHAYLSPQVYPDLARVPTWNYLAVHCSVRARLVDSVEAKDALLKRLIADHEPPYAEQWRGLNPDFANRLLGAVVAFELVVTRLECKLKLNQHRPESHAPMYQRYRAGGENEQALARWMERLGLAIAPVEADPSESGRPTESPV